MRKIVVGITGASGAIYAKRLLLKLQQFAGESCRIDIVFSKNAEDVWKLELDENPLELFPFKYLLNEKK